MRRALVAALALGFLLLTPGLAQADATVIREQTTAFIGGGDCIGEHVRVDGTSVSTVVTDPEGNIILIKNTLVHVTAVGRITGDRYNVQFHFLGAFPVAGGFTSIGILTISQPGGPTFINKFIQTFKFGQIDNETRVLKCVGG